MVVLAKLELPLTARAFTVLVSIGLNANVCGDTFEHREMHIFGAEASPSNSIVIWDNWFSIAEGGVQLDFLEKDEKLKMIQSFEKNEAHKTIQFKIFVVK